jgi:hypothetical protein
MTDIRTETTFEVASTPAEAWKALEELRARAAGPQEWWLPGFECRVAEVEAEQERRLTVRKLDEPCADTLIAVTFEHAGTGARIHVVQSGFDEAFVKGAGQAFWTHAQHIFADLHLFFETGVIARRAWGPWTSLGVAVDMEPIGLRVRRVGGWAERVGLQEGDVLLTVAGAPLYSAADLGVIERVVRSGDEVGAAWVRDGARTEASATV